MRSCLHASPVFNAVGRNVPGLILLRTRLCPCATLSSAARKDAARTKTNSATRQLSREDSKRETRLGRENTSQTTSEEKDTLQWGDDSSMQPSKSLQERLKGLKRKQSTVMTAFCEDVPAEALRPPAKGDSDSPPASPPTEPDAEVVLPKPSHVKIKTAEYITSSVKLQQCPPAKYSEIAVIGRSNVGKSSLINMLTGRRELALVSKTPGKTRCINHFLINNSWYLVDLPGYGYAKTAMSSRLTWGKFTQQYLKERETLIQVLLLVDASVPTQSMDLGCAEWLHENQVPYSLVFTKIDKRKKRCPSPTENIATFEVCVPLKTDSLRIAHNKHRGGGTSREAASLSKGLANNDRSRGLQAELLSLTGSLPVSLETSTAGSRGKDGLLTYLAQLRALSKEISIP